MKTEQKRKPLEYNYDNYQKINWSIFIITVLAIIIFLFQMSMKLLNFGLVVLFGLVLISSIIVMFSKNGLVVNKNELYKADFFLGKLIFMSKVKISDNSVFTILKIRKKQKVVYSVASPDASYGLISYDIYLFE